MRAGLFVAGVVSGLGCGENVLVSRWEFGLKAPDAGLSEPASSEVEETAPPAAVDDRESARYLNAQIAERARVHAHKSDSHDDGTHPADDDSNH